MSIRSDINSINRLLKGKGLKIKYTIIKKQKLPSNYFCGLRRTFSMFGGGGGAAYYFKTEKQVTIFMDGIFSLTGALTNTPEGSPEPK